MLQIPFVLVERRIKATEDIGIIRRVLQGQKSLNGEKQSVLGCHGAQNSPGREAFVVHMHMWARSPAWPGKGSFGLFYSSLVGKRSNPRINNFNNKPSKVKGI